MMFKKDSVNIFSYKNIMTVPADDLAPNGARSSAATMMTDKLQIIFSKYCL